MKPEELIKWSLVKDGTLVEVRADYCPEWEEREFALIHNGKTYVYEEIYDDFMENGKTEVFALRNRIVRPGMLVGQR